MQVTFSLQLGEQESKITQQEVRTLRKAGRSIVVTLENNEQFSMPAEWITKIEITVK